MKQVKDDILIWESFSNPLQNQKYEFDGVDIESGNKKYTVYINSRVKVSPQSASAYS